MYHLRNTFYPATVANLSYWVKAKRATVICRKTNPFESVLLNHAFKMKGFNYLSSYSLMYDFMGAYKTLPKNTIYIGTLDHTFVELAVSYDPIFEYKVYLAKLFLPNLFAVFIKTDFYPFEDLIDYEESTYDCVLLVLFFEMSVKDYNCIFHPSKTA